MGKLSSYLHNDKPMTVWDYKSSKKAIIINGAATCCCGSFIGGSYFAGLLKYMGASEVLSNFILSMAPLAGLFLILVPYIITNREYKKPFVMLCSLFEYFPLAIAFLLPIITGSTMPGVIAAAVLFAVHSIVANMKTAPFQEWILNCASGGEDGASSFFGFKDGIANAVLIATYLVLGLITRFFTGEKEGVGYVIIGVITIVSWVIGMVSLFVVKEPYKPKTQKVKVNVFKMLWEMLCYKEYKPYFIYQIFYTIAIYAMNSVIFVMCVQRFGLKLEILSYLTVVDLVLRTFLAVFFGRLADKIGEKPVIAVGIMAFISNAMLHLFMTAQNAYLFKTFSVVFTAIAYSATSAPSFVYMFECLPKKDTSGYIACHNIVMLIVATLVSFASATFIDIAEGFSLNIFGRSFTEMNLVFLFSAVMYAISAIYLLVRHKAEKAN